MGGFYDIKIKPQLMSKKLLFGRKESNTMTNACQIDSIKYKLPVSIFLKL